MEETEETYMLMVLLLFHAMCMHSQGMSTKQVALLLFLSFLLLAKSAMPLKI